MDASFGRAYYRYHLAFVSTVYAEVVAVDGDDTVPRVELAHTDEAEVCQVGLTVPVSLRKRFKVRKVLPAIERDSEKSLPDELQHERGVLQMKRGLCENRFAGQKRSGYPLGQPDGPFVMLIVPVGKRHHESTIGDSLHLEEKPLREERSLGPRMDPARRRKAFPEAPSFDRSS